VDKHRLQELAGNAPVPLPMRWFDYYAVFIVADWSSALLFTGINYEGTYRIAPVLLVGAAVLLIQAWIKIYCPFRREQELKRLYKFNDQG